ncbi:hypothetical protein [Vallitalea sp.]|uniref:hypothetical protein n=1 Tax=Vallitalea sp. TaxID=1882829 RepID=UPI0026007E27|nr:hypothetical protein [Vallitalea sp.]MCT4686578.1 hypothetical protein [Vallitalea sp.]
MTNDRLNKHELNHLIQMRTEALIDSLNIQTERKYPEKQLRDFVNQSQYYIAMKDRESTWFWTSEAIIARKIINELNL